MDTQEKTPSFFRFEDLRIYAKAVDYSKWLCQNIGKYENESQKSLIDSFCHSSYDIALNIAEGSSRNKSQFEHYLKISKTAIRECVVFTEMAAGLDLFSDEKKEQSREMLMELTRMVGALIISLQRSQSKRDKDEPLSDMAVGAIDMIDTIETDF